LVGNFIGDGTYTEKNNNEKRGKTMVSHGIEWLDGWA